MLHNLRNLVATTRERLGLGAAALRRSDVLHRHYVRLGVEDMREPLQFMQAGLRRLTTR